MHSSMASGVHRITWGRRLLLAALVIAGVLALASPGSPATPIASAQGTPPWTANATGVSVNDHWMADLGGGIGRLRLQQVILPASHDSATYGLLRRATGGAPTYYAINQNIDVYTQLQHGIRELDLRGRNDRWDNTDDYYVYHGPDTSDLALSTVLDDVARWVAAPGHEKEITILNIEANRSELPARFDAMCTQFKNNLGSALLTPKRTPTSIYNEAQRLYEASLAAHNADPSVAPLPAPTALPDLGELDIARYTVNELWSLPGSPRVIAHWDDCVGKWQDNTWNAYFANQCYASGYNSLGLGQRRKVDRRGIVAALSAALQNRSTAASQDGGGGGAGIVPMTPGTFNHDQYGRNVPKGFYSLGLHASITRDCGFPLD